MKRIYPSCLFAGMALSGLTIANVAHGQATAQSPSPIAAPMPQGYGALSGSAPGGSMFPRGYQESPAAAPSGSIQASGQGVVSRGIPYPRSASTFRGGYQAPGASVGASGQAGAVGNIPYPRSASTFPRGYQSVAESGPGATSQAAGAMGAPAKGSGQGFAAGVAPYPPPVPGGTSATGQAGAYGTGIMGGAPEGEGAGEAGAGPGPGGARAPGGAEALTPPLGAGAAPTAPQPGATNVFDEIVAEDTGATSAFGLGPGATGGAATSSFTPNMIGDLSPFYAHAALAGGHSPPLPPGPHGAALFYPTLRNFKISENQSPRPQDRVFFDFNFYTNVNSTINTAQRSPINQMNAYVYMWGFEKTFDQGRGSIGMRLPLNSLTATSNTPGVSAPTSTALGNLDIFAKYILKENVETGSLITAGFQITPSTGTSRFAGAPYIYGLNTTYFQPFLAYIWRRDRFYLQGFSGFDFPAYNADVTLMYNDIGMGYFLYQNQDTSRFLTALAPTFEVHVNSPFNHRNPFNTFDPAASANVTNLTYGVNVMFYGRSMLTAALVTPVSSPKPFDTEFALFFNYYFGRTARRPAQIVPPVIQ